MIGLTIIQFGKIPKRVLDLIAKELKESFKISSKVLPPTELPKEFYNPFRKQFLSDEILNYLSKRFGEKTLAITDEDLYTDNLNFIFGEANLAGGIAIVSTHRLDSRFYGKRYDEKLLIERTLKESVHEVCHAIFGLGHCSNSECVMSFSNSIHEVDNKSKNLCKECKMKLKSFEI